MENHAMAFPSKPGRQAGAHLVVGAGAATRQFIGTCDTVGVTHVTNLSWMWKNEEYYTILYYTGQTSCVSDVGWLKQEILEEKKNKV